MSKFKIESELRYALSTAEFAALAEMLRSRTDLYEAGFCGVETTVMFDNPNEELSFYDANVDGRLRFRTIAPAKPEVLPSTSTSAWSGGLITWKQRVPGLQDDAVRSEREIEISLAKSEVESALALLTDVLKCPRVSSYERRRETLAIDGVEVALDLFPYGYIVELELKDGPIEQLRHVAGLLDLRESQISLLSCDDTYRLLCSHSGVDSRSDILFADKDMPSLDRLIEAGDRDKLRS